MNTNSMEAEIDNSVVLCAHSEIHNDQSADRFCLKCSVPVCNDCGFEFHCDHAAECKLKLNDFFSTKGKEEVKLIENDLTRRIDDSSYGRIIIEKSNCTLKNIQKFSKENEDLINALRGKLDSLSERWSSFSKTVEKSSKKEIEATNKNPQYSELIGMKEELVEYYANWDKLTMAHKYKLLKNKGEFLQTANKHLELLENSYPKIQQDSRGNILEKLLSDQNIKSEFSKIEESISNILQHIKNSETKIPNGVEERHVKRNSSVQVPAVNNLPEVVLPSKTVDFDYLITFRVKTQEIVIINTRSPSFDITSIKIGPDMFIDSCKSKLFPLDNAKWVNFGESVLVTGGTEASQSYENTYIVKVQQVSSAYKVLISNYIPLREKRERHNLVYIEARKAFICCSGFYSKTCEMHVLNTSTWDKLPDLKESRANATLMVQNNRFVYILSGFQVVDRDRPNGVYLNSCEWIDLDSNETAWKFFDFTTLNSNIKLCAMGILEISLNKILLVGGYDGYKYLNDVHEITFDGEKGISTIHNAGKKNGLNRGVIFTSNFGFIKVGSKAINFDLTCKLVMYDINEKEFSIKDR